MGSVNIVSKLTDFYSAFQIAFGGWFVRNTHLFAICFCSSGPEGTSFEGGVFTTRLTFPHDYPLSPPKMRFVGEMFHPNGMYLMVRSIVNSS